MKNCVLTYLAFAVFLCICTHSKATQIHGTASEYANFDIPFYTYKDFLSNQSDTLFVLHINSDGSFEKSFEIEKPRPVFAYIGIYKIWFIAEPNENYEIVLPDFIEKTMADIYNPYFQPVLLMAGMKNQNPNALNKLINQFDYRFNNMLEGNLLSLISKGKESEVEKYIDSLKVEFSYNESEYFNAWKKFRFATMRRIVYQRNNRYTINHYFNNETIFYQNPAYMNLYLELFKNYFDRFILRDPSNELLTAVNIGKSPHLISKVLSRMFELSDQRLREFVMIKGLQDAYYSKSFKRKSVLIALDSIALKSEFDEHKSIAKNVINDLIYMNEGTTPPDITYENRYGDTFYLAKQKDQNLYIAFFHTELTGCREQIQLLKELALKHEGSFQVKLLVFDENKEKALHNLRRYKLPFEVYFPRNKELVRKQWEIKAFPTYFLIGPDGKLIFSPAAGPHEYFENHFFRYANKKN